jgi:hypothetical protein
LLDGRTWDEFPQIPQIALISKEKTSDSTATLSSIRV